MKLELILADDCAACKHTERVWRRLSREYGLEFTAMAFKTSARARELTQRHDLKVFPALVVDNQVRAVGSPSAEHAHRILREIIPDDP